MSTIKKILGLVLLFVGLAIIFYSLYSSYNIFTAKTEAPEIFMVEEKEEVKVPGAGDIQAQIQRMVGEQLKGMLPAGSIPRLLNLIAWSIFAGILIFGGAQISSIGIKLIKK